MSSRQLSSAQFSSQHLARAKTARFGDFTALSTLERVVATGVICAGIWVVIAYTIMGG